MENTVDFCENAFLLYYLTDLFIRDYWSEGPKQQLLQFPPVHPEERTLNKALNVNVNVIEAELKKKKGTLDTYFWHSRDLVGSSGWVVRSED